MSIRVFGPALPRGVSRQRGGIDASLAANLPDRPMPGDRYRVTVAGNFENSPLIRPVAGNTWLSVGDQMEFQDVLFDWLKIESGDNLLDAAYGVNWATDDKNTAVRKNLYDKFEAETAARMAGDSAEAASRVAADGVLQTNINTEAAARASGDSTLQTNINTESTNRSNADTALQANITAEANTRATNDSTLQTNITAEETARIAAVGAVQGNLNTETTNRTNADATLQGNITAEATTRGNADTTLQGNIDAEVTARGLAVSGEATARANADTTLQGNITAEANTRSTNDATLQTNINAEATARGLADTAEATARADADTALTGRINNIEEVLRKDEIFLVDDSLAKVFMDIANRSGTAFANATTYPMQTATGAGATENGLTDGTEDVQGRGAPLVLNFSAASNATHLAVKRVAGVTVDNQGIITKVEASADNVTFVEIESESYWRGYAQSRILAGQWADGAMLYYPVNKTQKAYIRITLNGQNNATYSLSKLSWHGYAGTGSLERWDFTNADFSSITDIDPQTFVSDTGDRWVYITSSAGNIGASTQLVHESFLLSQAALNNVTAMSIFVDGGNFWGQIGTYARTVKLKTNSLTVRTGETFDLRGNFTVNGQPLDAGATAAIAAEQAARIAADGVLQTNINNISLTPGPQGPQGIQGIQGPVGPQGPAGADGGALATDNVTLEISGGLIRATTGATASDAFNSVWDTDYDNAWSQSGAVTAGVVTAISMGPTTYGMSLKPFGPQTVGIYNTWYFITSVQILVTEIYCNGADEITYEGAVTGGHLYKIVYSTSYNNYDLDIIHEGDPGYTIQAAQVDPSPALRIKTGPNGGATLGPDGKVPSSQLSASAIVALLDTHFGSTAWRT